MFRSLLYVPANAPKFIEKAHLRNADAIILDLEDAVPEDKKHIAREQLQHAVQSVGQNGAAVFVRVNSDSRWLENDLTAVCSSGAFGVYMPKVSSVDHLDFIDDFLSPLETLHNRPNLKVVALIEDSLGVLNAPAIAQHPRTLALSVGSEDLATSMGAAPLSEVLRFPKLQVHFAAKAYQRYSFGILQSIVTYQDLKIMHQSIVEAKQFGFDGATCIHPSVVTLLNEGFSANEAEIEYAQRLLIEASHKAEQGVGAFNFEGNFVDAPIIQRAKQLLNNIK